MKTISSYRLSFIRKFNTYTKKVNINWQRVLILFCYSCFLIIYSSCKENVKQKVLPVNTNMFYTCSMHPQVYEEHPGNCHICGMKLIAVPKTTGNVTTQIHLNAEQILLGNIHTDTIGKGTIANKTILTGTLNFNLDELFSENARVEGRVDKLYFKNVGDYVNKGDKLYDLYSEQLNNAKQEYINALKQAGSIGNTLINYSTLVESAKNKLLLWGMNDTQIKQLGESKQATRLTTFFSTSSGYITSFNVNEGEFVLEGGSLVQLASLKTLWAEAQVYTSQMSSINKSDRVSVQIPDLNNQVLTGTVDFINPEINPDARVNLVRVTIPNNKNQLHPGMLVTIIITNKQHNANTLPSDAVLRDSKGESVWIETSPGTYEIRMVTTGMLDNNKIEVLSGLKRGDVVVTYGAYLLNSEYIFKNGADPMAGMNMSGMNMK